MKNPQLVKLREIGQSVWYDNLSRDVLKSGELKSLIDAGVLGLTSNPSIFKKAIADSSDYDAAIKALISQGVTDPDAVCESLMIEDVGNAADLLRGIYDETKGADGCASIEVSPFLAHDTAGTIEAGRRIWKTLNRPNIMIKVPATKEGLPAVKTLLSEGINVNITLIFSVEVYAQVVEAYLSALEERAAQGKPIDRIASVASFFVSRVDAISETKMEEFVKAGTWTEADREKYFGKIGIANSKLAYKKYLEIFGSDRFSKLKAKGALVQRPLWASTGTKNPKFSAVMYVEELSGPDTVNTMPPGTLKALMEKATIKDALQQNIESAVKLVDDAKKQGIPFDALLLDLQAQGVKLFAEAFKDLLDSVSAKLKKVA